MWTLEPPPLNSTRSKIEFSVPRLLRHREPWCHPMLVSALDSPGLPFDDRFAQHSYHPTIYFRLAAQKLLFPSLNYRLPTHNQHCRPGSCAVQCWPTGELSLALPPYLAVFLSELKLCHPPYDLSSQLQVVNFNAPVRSCPHWYRGFPCHLHYPPGKVEPIL